MKVEGKIHACEHSKARAILSGMLLRRLILLVLLLLSYELQAREVDSNEDAVRLQGYFGYKNAQSAWDSLRLSDVSEIAKQRQKHDEEQKLALFEYQIQRANQAEVVKESGPDYHHYLMSKVRYFEELEEQRHEFVQERDMSRMQHRLQINLSEERELAIYEGTDRVPWKKRKFFDAGGGHSSAGSNSAGLPPLPPPPPPPAQYPGYYDNNNNNNYPPPPPPFAQGYDGGESYDDQMPPPPPPMYDGQPPPVPY